VEESKNDQRMIRFVVEDKGIGIPPDKVDNMFKKFYQVDIIEAHGSNLWIDKSYDNGHRIIFTQPKSSQKREE